LIFYLLNKPQVTNLRQLRANELWDANPALFENLGFPDVDALTGAANAGQLVNHPFLSVVK